MPYLSTMVFYLVVAILCPQLGHAQNVRMSYAGTTGFNVPFWLTYEAGFFKKQGLRAEQILISGGATNIQALLAGDLQFVNASGSGPLNAMLNGAGIVIIASSYNFMPYGLVVNEEIRSPGDLKGKKIAVSRLGGITEVAVRLALDKLGLDARETTLIQAGPDAPRIAAVASGAAAATVLAPPGLFKAEALGLRILADLGDLGLSYPASVIVAKRSYLAEQPGSVKKFLMAFIEGLHLYKTNKKFSIEVMQKYTKLHDAELLSKSHDYFVKNTPLIPLTEPKAIKNALPADKGRSINVEEFYDNSFLKEIASSGFVDKLAKQGK